MAKIDYKGNIDAKGKRHRGIYIASGPSKLKVMFRPGVNNIADDEWIALRGGRRISQMLADGDLVVLEAPKEFRKGDPGEVEIDFGKLGPARALEIVKRTIDASVLEEWLAAEKTRRGKKKRAGVLEALREQLEAVTTDSQGNPTEPREIDLPGPRGLSPGEREVTPGRGKA